MFSATSHLILSKRSTWDKTTWYVGSTLGNHQLWCPCSQHPWLQGGHLVMWLMVINLPPPRILTPPPCPPWACSSPWAPCSYSSSSRHYSVFLFCFQKPHSSKSSFYSNPLSLSQTGISCSWPNLPNINQMCVNYSSVCLQYYQLRYIVFELISLQKQRFLYCI